MVELIDGITQNRYNMNYMDVYEVIYNMMGHEEGIKEIFYNKQNRLYASNPMCLILVNGEIAGFINLVQEEIDNVKFIDMAISNEYRGKGIGTVAIQCLNLNYHRPYIIGETLRDNVAGNRIGHKLGKFVYVGNKSNYYLFQPNRLNYFVGSNEFKELVNHDEQRKVYTKRLNK